MGVVACYSRRIPTAALALPRHGILNLHPSLLPAYRGPTPVFWQLRDGAPTGVTVHYLGEELDAGDIAAQAECPLPDGINEGEGEGILMTAGLELLRGVLDDLARGIIRRRPQPPGGSYFGFPRESDFILPTTWSARRAFNFMRGTTGRGQLYPVELSGRVERLALADHYEPDLELDRPSVRHGRHILIRFSPGILYARTA
ncbi:MAG TPA: formyltransferase family protein [Promineifilum sp.]|nr:formyltransferase family protein [Promineifilum sp.]